VRHREISRRNAIVLGGLGAAALAAGTTGWLAQSARQPAGHRLRPAATGAGLRQPPLLDSRDGRLAVELTAGPGVRLAGRDTRALGYNGSSPGPTLRVRPGDELAVRLTNRLDQPTNLHTHGLRVSPEGNSDNPFLRVDPGDSFDYLFRIPADHPAGTHWYHPHHHGTVADQLFGGLAGALLVDRGADLPVTTERVLLITDTTLLDDGQVAPVSTMDRMLGREGELVLVNGQYRPSVPATPGTTQRWRIINGCTSRVLPLRLDGHRLAQVALDGTFLPAPTEQESVVLAPGNRADVVVRPAAGRFELWADAHDRGRPGGMMRPGPGAPVNLATLVGDGPGQGSPPLPPALPVETPSNAPVTGSRRIDLQMEMGGGTGRGGMRFAIDGRTYDPERDDQTLAAGDVEEWTITNSSPLDHPFHLHVWPFTVVGGAAATGTPQDVVLVPARGQVRLRIPFTRHSGRSVYHCHILDHEDNGMMATVDVRG
jgi:FtsP/CotA-like multicopper oxidase with cupredoxin domain